MIGTEAFRGRLIAAVPIPLQPSGELHAEGLGRMIASIGQAPVDGVAVGTTMARASRLEAGRRADLLAAWREGLRGGRWLVAPAGAAPEIRRPAEVFESAVAMAAQALERGADLLLAEPPGSFRGRPDRDRLLLEYHLEIAEVGLPMLVSYRRESSGGIAYNPEVLAQLLARPEVLGVEVGTIDGIAAFQQVEALVRAVAPAKRVVSGEDRFLGYSLMCGADAALVGVAAVDAGMVAGLMRAHFEGDAPRFLAGGAEVNRLARGLFAPPMEAIPLRLLDRLVQGGILPPDAANDPWGPRPPRPPSHPSK